MATYLDTTRFATLQLFNVIAWINNSLNDIRRTSILLGGYQQGLDNLTKRFDAARNHKNCDPQRHAAGVTSLENRIREYRESFADSEASILSLQKQMEYFNLSSDALRMSILQIVRQGISVVHSGSTNCPDGRMIGSQPLKTVIWEARNQAIHYDEGIYRKPVLQCFAALVADFDDRFSLDKHRTTNLSAQIFDLLGWRDYPTYESDMKLLLEL